MLYEDLLTNISKSGPCYRWTITILIAFLSMKSAFDMFVLNLATIQVPFHCKQAIVDNETLPLDEVAANYTFAQNITVYNFTCKVPRFYKGFDGLLYLIEKNDSKTEAVDKCSSWVFNPEPRDHWTMLMEYEMVCDREYLMDRIQTVMQLGVCLSTLLGPLGDIIGRKPVLILFCYIDLTSTFAVIFLKDLTWQMVLRFFMGFGGTAIQAGIVLITELVAEDYRGVHGNLLWVLWVTGYSGSAAISYFVNNWRLRLVVVVIIVGAGYATYIPALPESPRWLLTRRKTKRAEKTLKQICKFSGCKDALQGFNIENNELVNPPHESGEVASITKKESCIFKFIPHDNLCRPVYFITLAVVTFNYFTVSLVYFALSFQRNFITNDPYLNVLISGLLELPAYIVAWQLTNRAGRKYTSLGTMAFCGVGLIVLPYVPVNKEVVFQSSSVLAIAIKFSVTVAFSVLAVYGSEVLPTKVRSCSFFFASFIMTVAQFLAPEMGGALQKVYKPLPNVIYGGISLLASLTILLLPETKDKPMPNIVAEMEPVRCPCDCPVFHRWMPRHSERQVHRPVEAFEGGEELKPLRI